MRWVDAAMKNYGTNSAVTTDQNGKTVYDGQIEDFHIRVGLAIIAPKSHIRLSFPGIPRL